MKRKDTKTNKISDRFWIFFTHPDEKQANKDPNKEEIYVP